jgi:hypothetical protein
LRAFSFMAGVLGLPTTPAVYKDSAGNAAG